MVKTTGTFLSTDNKTNVAYYVYTPEPAVIPKAVLQIAHGMCEYIERYENFAEFLTSNGVVVCGNDHLGHGKTAASDDDLGYFGDGAGYENLVGDIEEMRKLMRKKYRRLPYLILGHSMGSFVLRAYMTRFGENIDGAVICGTSGANPKIGSGLFLTKLITAFRGKRYRSQFVRGQAFKGYNDSFEGDNPNRWLVKDLKTIEKYGSDKYCTFIFTVSAYTEMFKMLKEVSGEEWAQEVPKQLPIFIISGSDDPVGNHGEGPKEVCNKLLDAEVNELKLRLYDGDRHEILNETDRETVYTDVLAFIDEVCEGVVEARTLL